MSTKFKNAELVRKVRVSLPENAADFEEAEIVELLAENNDDEEIAAACRRLLDGANVVFVGGGAAQMYRITLA